MVLRISFQVKHKVLFILWCEHKRATPIWWGCWEVRRQLALTPQHYTAACVVSRAHLDMCREQQWEIKWEWTADSAMDVILQYICPDTTLYTKELHLPQIHIAQRSEQSQWEKTTIKGLAVVMEDTSCGHLTNLHMGEEDGKQLLSTGVPAAKKHSQRWQGFQSSWVSDGRKEQG